MATVRQKNKSEFWQRHIQAAKSFQGSVKKYCAKENLNINTFQYWRHKLENRGDHQLPLSTAFVPVQIQHRKQTLDAKWIAEFICELHARLQ